MAIVEHRPNLAGVPLNIQKELEYLRAEVYRLNAKIQGAPSTSVGSTAPLSLMYSTIWSGNLVVGPLPPIVITSLIKGVSILRADLGTPPTGSNVEILASYFPAGGIYFTAQYKLVIHPGSKLVEIPTRTIGFLNLDRMGRWEIEVTAIGSGSPGANLTVTIA